MDADEFFVSFTPSYLLLCPEKIGSFPAKLLQVKSLLCSISIPDHMRVCRIDTKTGSRGPDVCVDPPDCGSQGFHSLTLPMQHAMTVNQFSKR